MRYSLVVLLMMAAVDQLRGDAPDNCMTMHKRSSQNFTNAEVFSRKYCSLFDEYLAIKLPRAHVVDFTRCIDAVKPYMLEIVLGINENISLERLVKTLVENNLDQYHGASLLLYLKQFCWSVDDVIELVLMTKSDVLDIIDGRYFLRPDEWRLFVQVNNFSVEACGQMFPSTITGQTLTLTDTYTQNVDDLKVMLFADGNASDDIKSNNCDCNEAFKIKELILGKDSVASPREVEIVNVGTTYRLLCFNKDKDHHWSTNQLAMLTSDYSKEVMLSFLKYGGPITKVGWCEDQSAPNCWTFNEIITVSQSMSGTPIQESLVLIAAAMERQWTSKMFSNVHAALSGSLLQSCMSSIMNRFFDKSNSRGDMLQARLEKVTLLKSIVNKSERINCDDVIDTYDKMERTVNGNKWWHGETTLLQFLNIAQEANTNLQLTYFCVKMASSMENVQRQVWHGDHKHLAEVNKLVDEFRQKLFERNAQCVPVNQRVREAHIAIFEQVKQT